MASDVPCRTNQPMGGAASGTQEGIARRWLSPQRERILLLSILTLLWLSAGAWIWRHCGSWRGVLDAAYGRPLSVQTVELTKTEHGKKATVTLEVRNILLRELTILGAAWG